MNLNPCYLSFLLLLLLLHTITPSIGFPQKQRFNLEHIDPTLPPVFPGQTPTCSAVILQQYFVGIVGSPLVSANYTHPKGCPFPWTRIILELSLSATEMQRHHTAAVWIDGAEVLRSTSPIPMAPGAFWKVQKDVTRYSALFHRLGVVYLMLQNSNHTLPGVYNANVSLHFYRNVVKQTNDVSVTSHPTVKRLYPEPADVILPISRKNGYFGSGFWFKINSENHVVKSDVDIPMNAYRAVLEIFVSYHGTDENWYTNPLRAPYCNQPSNLSTQCTNGGFRQIYATIDNMFIGGHIPFAVVYPNSINSVLWSPVASIGTFDMPSYDLDITPLLGLLLDGQPHKFGLGVRDAKPYWLLSANLHLWIDKFSDTCQAQLIEYNLPALKLFRDAKWTGPDGQSRIDADGFHKFVGWVSSSRGNLTTIVQHKTQFSSSVEVQNLGLDTQVEIANKETVQVEVLNGDQSTLRSVELVTDAPLKARTSRSSAAAGSMLSESTSLFHKLEETMALFENQVATSSRLTDRQDAEGLTLMRGDGDVVWENGSTRSEYMYVDGGTCYVREVNTAGGLIMMDNGYSCASMLVSEI